MTRVEALAEEIEKLSGPEFAELRDLILEKDWDRWDRQIAADATAGKLDKLFEKALADHRAGKSREI